MGGTGGTQVGAVAPSPGAAAGNAGGAGGQAAQPNAADWVPISRFEEVNEERKAHLQERERLVEELKLAQSQLAAAQGGGGGSPGSTPVSASVPTAGGVPEIPSAPDGLTPNQQVYWMITEGMKAALPQLLPTMLEQTYGVPVAQQKQFFSSAPALLDESANTQYARACVAMGIDPEHVGAKAAFRGLLAMDDKLSAVDALKQIKEQFGDSIAPKVSPASRVGSPVTSGVSASTTVENVPVPKTPAEATQLAMEGKRAPDLDVNQIFAMGRDQRSGRA